MTNGATKISVSRWAMGGSAVTAAFIAGLMVAGSFPSGGVPRPDSPVDLVPMSSKDSLTTSDDCKDLLDWYVDRNLPQVGPYGWDGPVIAYSSRLGSGAWEESADVDRDLAGAAQLSPQSDSVGLSNLNRASSATGTNTQEVDVDEPDAIKTDGRRMVRVVAGIRLSIADVTGSEPDWLGSYWLPRSLQAHELLLVGDHALVSAIDRDAERDHPVEPGWGRSMLYDPEPTILLDVDLSDPTKPELVRKDTYTGGIISLRQYDDVVRVVTATRRPQFDWTFPDQVTDGPDERQAANRNRALVENSTLEDWVPSVTTEQDGRKTTKAVACEDVLHTQGDSGNDTLAVHTFDVDSPEDSSSVALTTDSEIVYSSTDRLYVATNHYGRDFWTWARGRVTGSDSVRPSDVRTRLHAFELDGTETRYVASGHVKGVVKDRWSLDEQEGRLRVAYGELNRFETARENGVAILSEQDGVLVVTGQVDRLGIDEEIKSVRWFDEFAVVVTFRQIDPLYTIDLRDPSRPEALGELKIPGFSGYLHPLGGDLLLGLGVGGDETGQTFGAQAAIFDISDLRDPRRLSVAGFDRDTAFAALEDPRAFTWLPEARAGVTTLHDWQARMQSVPTVLEITQGGKLESEQLVEHAENVGAQRTLPLDDGRVAIVGHEIHLLTIG